MPEKVLEIAGRITNPITASAFAVAFLGLALYRVVKLKNRPIGWLLTAGVIVVGFAPGIAATYLAARGVYRIRIVVLGSDNQPINEQSVAVSASSGGEMKRTEGGWEIDIPPQARPADGRVTIYAKYTSAFLQGSSELTLKSDYFPTAEIHMGPAPSVAIRGEVMDERQRAVANADVILPTCSQATEADAHGLFHFDSCVAAGQMVTIRAQRGDLSGSATVPAGDGVQIVLSKD